MTTSPPLGRTGRERGLSRSVRTLPQEIANLLINVARPLMKQGYQFPPPYLLALIARCKVEGRLDAADTKQFVAWSMGVQP